MATDRDSDFDVALDESDDSSTVNRDLEAIQKRFFTDGYREGHAISKEKALQRAFDDGYSEGAILGWNTGLAYGALAASAWALENNNISISAVNNIACIANDPTFHQDATQVRLECEEILAETIPCMSLPIINPVKIVANGIEFQSQSKRL